MKLNDLFNIIAYSELSMLQFINHNGAMQKTFGEIYSSTFISIPLIICKDGFSISIQIGKGNYCGSENGYREYGNEWKIVEWGFPSAPIDAVKYNCETDTTMDSVGTCEIALMDELLEEHGGIDFHAMALHCQKKSQMADERASKSKFAWC